jgi:hypothetical protein
VAGIREPGLEGQSKNSGVYKFAIPKPGETFAPTSASTTTTTGARATNITLEPTQQPCVDTTCDMFEQGITLREPPAGLQPTLTLRIDTNPFKVTVRQRSRHAGPVDPTRLHGFGERGEGLRAVHLRKR